MKKSLTFIVLIFAILGCYNPEVNVWDVLTIKEGNKKSKPYRLTWNDNVNVAYKWKFTESCQYDIGEDQCSWNVITGYAVDFINSQKNSVFVVWRWDSSGFWWVAPSYYRDGVVNWADAMCSGYEVDLNTDNELTPIAVYPGQEFETHFSIREDLRSMYCYIECDGAFSFFELKLPVDFKNTRELYPSFPTKAPNDMDIKRLLISVE